MILTEDQVRALEKAREEKEAHGEIETEHLRTRRVAKDIPPSIDACPGLGPNSPSRAAMAVMPSNSQESSK